MSKICRKPLYVMITLADCNGQNLASWPYDETFPVIPPQFTFPNASDYAPYVLKFLYTGHADIILPSHIDINIAIYNATQEHIKNLILATDPKEM